MSNLKGGQRFSGTHVEEENHIPALGLILKAQVDLSFVVRDVDSELKISAPKACVRSR